MRTAIETLDWVLIFFSLKVDLTQIKIDLKNERNEMFVTAAVSTWVCRDFQGIEFTKKGSLIGKKSSLLSDLGSCSSA